MGLVTDRWYLGVWMCDAWLSIDYCASTASIFNLCVLSLDRYWSITSPLKYLRRRTKRRAFFMIAAAWALSLLWILPVTGWSSMVNKDGGKLNSPGSCDTEFADNITFKVRDPFSLSQSKTIYRSDSPIIERANLSRSIVLSLCLFLFVSNFTGVIQ